MSARRTLLPIPFLLVASMISVGAQDAPAPPKSLNQNVRVDVAIALRGEPKPIVKNLSMVAADGKMARARAGIEIPVASGPIIMSPNGAPQPVTYNYRSVGINVDATPQVLDSTHVLLRFNWQFQTVYRPEGPATTQPSFGSGTHDSQGIVFDSGKPLVITQAADGETGREYTVTVTATILK